jgi:RNA polymerase sigma-70 factor (ECF subfamily)
MSLSDQETLQTLMAARTRVVAAVWIVVRDAQPAEDIFQNVAVKTMTKNVSFDSEEAAISWALTTARREGIDWLRRRRIELPVLDEESLELLDRGWENGSGADNARSEALQECLSEIPETSRRLLRLRYFEGYACKDVARELGVGLDAVYQRLSRLHRSLKACVEQRLNLAEVVRYE